MAGAVKPGRQNWQWPWYSPAPAPRPRVGSPSKSYPQDCSWYQRVPAVTVTCGRCHRGRRGWRAKMRHRSA